MTTGAEVAGAGGNCVVISMAGGAWLMAVVFGVGMVLA
jgi:hypothetical protein